MKFKFRVRNPGPRPPFHAIAEHLWGAGVNFDSDGDSRTLEDPNWTELTVIRRDGTDERLDIDPVAEEPLTLQVVSESRDLARRAAAFLADATGGGLEEDER